MGKNKLKYSFVFLKNQTILFHACVKTFMMKQIFIIGIGLWAIVLWGCDNAPSQDSPSSALSAQTDVLVHQDTEGGQKTGTLTAWDTVLAQKIAVVRKGKTRAARWQLAITSFLGTPYLENTLDQNEIEQLVIQPDRLDCWTYVESCLALFLCAEMKDATTQDYAHFIQRMRYSNGKIDGYGSRIHYFTDWMVQVAENGWLQDVTRDCGGEDLQKNISFMTAYPSAYPHLADKMAFQQVLAAEKRLSERHYFYLPKSKLADWEHTIHAGDLIALTTPIQGLDVVHQGWAVKRDGRIHLLHATSVGARKVIVSKKPLSDYMKGISDQNGLIIMRLK